MELTTLLYQSVFITNIDLSIVTGLTGGVKSLLSRLEKLSIVNLCKMELSMADSPF